MGEHWEILAQQVRHELGDLPDEILKYQVALKMYGDDPETRMLIERGLQQALSRQSAGQSS